MRIHRFFLSLELLNVQWCIYVQLFSSYCRIESGTKWKDSKKKINGFFLFNNIKLLHIHKYGQVAHKLDKLKHTWDLPCFFYLCTFSTAFHSFIRIASLARAWNEMLKKRDFMISRFLM